MATAYLYKTLGTPTNTKKYTFSTWVKRALASNEEVLISGGTSGSNGDFLVFRTTDQLEWQMYHGSNTGILKTNRLFRDPSAWYHIVITYDSANATAGDRMKMYVNGVEETSFATDTNPPQDTVSYINSAVQNNIGYDTYGLATSAYFSGVMAHTQLCDGQAYAASDFGQTDSTSGIWVAKTSPSVTYGNNGFFLKYQDTSAFGDDSSGNNNDFTMSGTITQTKDTPDNNFATWNPLAQPNGTLSNGNTSNSGCEDIGATLGAIKGKWYWEYKRTNTTNSLHYGICSTIHGFNCAPQQMLNTGTNAVGSCIYISEGGTGNTTYGSAGGGFSSPSYSVPAFSIANGDVVGCALDISTSSGTVEWFKNGTSLGTASFTYDQVTEVYPFIRMNSGATTDTNFGNGYFGTTAISSAGTSSSGDDSVWEYNCPADHYGFNTKNIATYG
jgi:hypothetical protein